MFGSGGIEQVQVSGTLEEDDYMRFGLVSKIASLADEILRHVFRHGTGERSGRCLRSSAESRCDDQHENAEIELPLQSCGDDYEAGKVSFSTVHRLMSSRRT